MGLFSWLCKRCEQPLQRIDYTSVMNEWMEWGVAVSPQGEVLCGRYDGYGRLDGVKIAHPGGPNPCVYHYFCYMVEGQPGFTGPSRRDPGQGLKAFIVEVPPYPGWEEDCPCCFNPSGGEPLPPPKEWSPRKKKRKKRRA